MSCSWVAITLVIRSTFPFCLVHDPRISSYFVACLYAYLKVLHFSNEGHKNWYKNLLFFTLFLGNVRLIERA
ncbi:hypothetical protein HanRHA438_Chr01g0004831 [Helianthus annuus]|nr:hypothetical protein HanRHA438_Chr01g0004831 [Helianthus annuus]